MADRVNPIPNGYRSAIPYHNIKGAADAIDYDTRVFGATVQYRKSMPNGAIGHAELRIGDALFMLADEFAEMDVRGPKSIGGTSFSTYVYVDDVDALAKRAIEAGVKVLRPVENQFYGDRSIHFEDPFGHRWCFATHVEDVSPEALERRSKAKFGG
jgi:PhnB protein